MLTGRLQPKTTTNLVLSLWLGKYLKNFRKCGLFSDFQHGFRSSKSTADLLTVVPDRIVLSEYLLCLILSDQHPYNNNNQNLDFLETYYDRADAFKYSSFPCDISE